MKPYSYVYSSCCLISLLAAAPLAIAEEDITGPNASGLILGAAYGKERSLYKGGESDESLIPLIQAFWGPIFFIDGKLGGYVAGNDDWAVYISAGLDEIEDKDRGGSPLLTGMSKLKDVYTASIGAELWQDWGELSFSVSTDISQRHEGQTAELAYSYVFALNQHSVSPSVAVSWMNEDVTRYYYGVRPHEQNIDRPTYQPDAALFTTLGLNYSFAFSQHHSIMLDTTWRQVSKEISESTIVGDSHIASLLVAYIYSF